MQSRADGEEIYDNGWSVDIRATFNIAEDDFRDAVPPIDPLGIEDRIDEAWAE